MRFNEPTLHRRRGLRINYDHMGTFNLRRNLKHTGVANGGQAETTGEQAKAEKVRAKYIQA